MANNPMDFPKSKIPVPESPYLTASRSGYLADLSDQVFFDENVPTPVDPITKRPKTPPYSYGPPGILHDSSALGQSSSPRRKSRRRRPPDITTSEYVDSRLEELLGPSVTLDVDDSVDDILDSVKRRGSRELRDTKYADHSRYSDTRSTRKRDPVARSHESGLSDVLGLPSESEPRRDLLSKATKGIGAVGRLKDGGSKISLSSRPDSRASDHPSSRPPSDKPPVSHHTPVKAPSSPKKSPAKTPVSLKVKDTDIRDVKAIVGDTNSKVTSEVKKKVQETLVKADVPSTSKLKDAVVAGAAGISVGAAASAAVVRGKLTADVRDKKDADKDKGQKPAVAGSSNGETKGDKEKGKDASSSEKKDADGAAATKPAFSGTDIHGHSGIDLSKLDEHKREEFMKDHSQGMKLLQFCQAADWYGVENQLRYFEKRVQNGAVNYKPLATIKDEVWCSISSRQFLLISFVVLP